MIFTHDIRYDDADKYKLSNNCGKYQSTAKYLYSNQLFVYFGVDGDQIFVSDK